MFRILIKDLRISPLRTFLTGFSMYIGIIAMISAVLVGTLGRNSLLSINAQIFGNTPTYSINISQMNFKDEKKTEAFFQKMNADPCEKAIVVSPNDELQFAPLEKLENLEDNPKGIYKKLSYIDTIYTSVGYNKIYNIPIYQGRWFTSNTESAVLEMVVNKSASELFSSPYAVASSKSSLSLIPLNVIGIVNDGKEWPVIYINVEALFYRIPNLFVAQNASIYWYNNSNLQMEDMQSFVSDLLYDTIGGSIENATRIDSGDNYDSVIDMLQLGLIVSATLLLFVSVLGQINIGLSSLEQRTHELLIRRALGASRLNISILVLGSQFILSIVVCLIAVITSMGIVQIISFILPVDSPISSPDYPIVAALAAVLTSVLTALLGGVIPAIKASKLEPALALR